MSLRWRTLLMVSSLLLGAACSPNDSAAPATGAVSQPPSSTLLPPSSTLSPPSSEPATSVAPSSASSTAELTSGPWPPNLSPAEQQSAQAALAAYTDFWQVKDASAADPSKDWSADFEKVATGQIAGGAVDYLVTLKVSKQHQVGSTALTATVLSVTSDAVTMQGCVNRTSVHLVDSAGAAVDSGEVVPAAFQTATATLQADGGYKVDELVNPNPMQTC
jgi:hypothetical protein